jgi:hypothetical protein
MARTPDPKRHVLWRDCIYRQAASGFTVAQFCAEECISRSKFYAWKYRLRDQVNHRSTLPVRQTFLPVTLQVLEHGSNERLSIEADLPNGVHLRIPTANLHLACRLVSALARAKTELGGSR